MRSGGKTLFKKTKQVCHALVSQKKNTQKKKGKREERKEKNTKTKTKTGANTIP